MPQGPQFRLDINTDKMAPESGWFQPQGDPYAYRFVTGDLVEWKKPDTGEQGATTVQAILRDNPGWLDQPEVRRNAPEGSGTQNFGSDIPPHNNDPDAIPASELPGSAPAPAQAESGPGPTFSPKGDPFEYQFIDKNTLSFRNKETGGTGKVSLQRVLRENPSFLDQPEVREAAIPGSSTANFGSDIPPYNGERIDPASPANSNPLGLQFDMDRIQRSPDAIERGTGGRLPSGGVDIPEPQAVDVSLIRKMSTAPSISRDLVKGRGKSLIQF